MKIKDIVEIIETYTMYKTLIENGYPSIPFNKKEKEIFLKTGVLQFPSAFEIQKYRNEQWELYKEWLEQEVKDENN